jgi:hypothetical protein
MILINFISKFGLNHLSNNHIIQQQQQQQQKYTNKLTKRICSYTN